MIRTSLIVLLMALPQTAAAIDLNLPGAAVMTVEKTSAIGDFALPVGPYVDGQIETLDTRGAVAQHAWRLNASGLSTLQILDHLSEQLTTQGYEHLFACRDELCGGFDFRFAVLVLGEPDMHVDLGDFRYIASRKPAATEGGAPEYISLLISRSPSAGYVQIVQVGPSDAKAQVTVTSTMTAPDTIATVDSGPIGTLLETQGHAVLADLVFATGSSDLGDASFGSLSTLATYLVGNPEMRVALVGHTDAEGALDANIALSKRRATSVMQRLISNHGVPASQLTAEGVGYLSPMASNLDAAGRTKNRRVEVVLTTTR